MQKTSLLFRLIKLLRVATIASLLFGFLSLQNVQAQTIVLDGPYQTQITFQSITPSPAFINQPVSISVLVEALDTAGGIPSGVVEVKSGVEKVCEITLGVNGAGSCVLDFDNPGVLPLQAFYLGTNVYLPAASVSRDVTVWDQYRPLVAITHDTPDPSILGRKVLVEVAVSSSFSTLPSGAVQVYRSLSSQCSAAAAVSAADQCTLTVDAAGEGACELALNAAGSINLCAVYAGDVAHYAAVSAAEAHTVSSSNSFVELLSLTPSPYILGEDGQAAFQVTSPDGSPNSGLVTVYAGQTRLCAAAASVGKCSFTFRQPNQQTIYATYAGEVDGQVVLQPSISDPLSISVFAAPTAIHFSTMTVNTYRDQANAVAVLSAVDLNPHDRFVFRLVPGAGDAGNRYFSVRENQLYALGHIPYGNVNLSIRLQVTDQTGLSFEAAYRLRLNENQPLLPATGFAPSRSTRLTTPRVSYPALGQVTLAIPSLKVESAIVGVALSPSVGDDLQWDTFWLGEQVGWLDGSAFPGWQGNAYLAAHNYLPSGLAGPFEKLADLSWGDQILIDAYGTRSVYEVRSVKWVSPNNKRVLTHEEDAWLTLVTCDQYDETQQAYRWRVVVRAVLVNVE